MFCQSIVDIELSNGDVFTIKCSNQVSEGHTLCTDIDSENHTARVWWD